MKLDKFSLKKQKNKGVFHTSPDIDVNLLGIEWFLTNNVIFDISSKRLYIEKDTSASLKKERYTIGEF